MSNNFQSRKERERERERERKSDSFLTAHRDPATTAMRPFQRRFSFLFPSLGTIGSVRSRRAREKEERKNSLHKIQPDRDLRNVSITPRRESNPSRALCRVTRTFVIKIPGTGGGDGAFASGGGDGDAGELMGRIRRATREQQTRDTSASSSKEVTIEFLCFCLFVGWGGVVVVFYVVYILRGKSSLLLLLLLLFSPIFFAHFFCFFCLPDEFLWVTSSTSWCRWWYGTHKREKVANQHQRGHNQSVKSYHDDDRGVPRAFVIHRREHAGTGSVARGDRGK